MPNKRKEIIKSGCLKDKAKDKAKDKEKDKKNLIVSKIYLKR